MIFGLPKLAAMLNDGDLRAAVFSENIEPKFVTRQLLSLAMNKNPEIVLTIVPNLEDLIGTIFGIKSCALGITRNGNLDGISGIFEILSTISPRASNVVAKSVSKSELIVPNSVRKPTGLSNNPVDFCSSIYLKRKEAKMPAWLPPAALETIAPVVPISKPKSQWSDFISVDDDEMEIEENDDKDRLKTILFSTSVPPIIKPSRISKDIHSTECGAGSSAQSVIFVTPAERNIFTEINVQKSSNKKGKKKVVKPKYSGNLEPSFIAMKVHKVQPDPKKIKRAKKNKKSNKKI